MATLLDNTAAARNAKIIGKPVLVDKASDGETKADAFKRLASARVGKALGMLKNIEHLANRSQYDFTAEQVAKIVGALRSEVDAIASSFDAALKGNSPARVKHRFEI